MREDRSRWALLCRSGQILISVGSEIEAENGFMLCINQAKIVFETVFCDLVDLDF